MIPRERERDASARKEVWVPSSLPCQPTFLLPALGPPGLAFAPYQVSFCRSLSASPEGETEWREEGGYHTILASGCSRAFSPSSTSNEHTISTDQSQG